MANEEPRAEGFPPLRRPVGVPAPVVVAACLAAAAGGVILACGLTGALGLLAGAAVGVALWLGVGRPSVILLLALPIFASAGALRSAGEIMVGGLSVSLSGVSTLIILLGASLSLLAHLKEIQPEWLRGLRPFWILCGLVAVRAAGAPSPGEGLRDAFLITVPVILGLLTRLAVAEERGAAARIETLLLLSPVVAAAVLIGGLSAGLVEFTEKGMIGIPARSLVLFLLVVAALALARWRYGEGRRERRREAWAGAVTLAAIVATLSRTASIIAMGFLLPMRFLRVDRIRLTRLVLGGAAAAAILFLLLQWPAMRQRFLIDSEPGTFDVRDLWSQVPTTGRDKIWVLVWNHALQAPIFGAGSGSSRLLVSSTFAGLDHPHCEYLRMFHDLGLVGLACFLWAWLGRARHHWGLWVLWERQGRSAEAKRHMAAFLACAAILLSFITDNALLYVFVMGPLFILFSLADASTPGRDSPASRGQNDPEVSFGSSIGARDARDTRGRETEAWIA